MKILQILNSPNWSGASNYCIQVSKELMDLGHEVLLITEPGKPLKRATEVGIPTDDTIRLNHRNPYLYLHAFKRMKRIISKFKPDIISAHINEGAWMAGLIAKSYFPETVVARVRTDIDPPKGHAINRYVHHKWTDHIVVGSIQHKKLCQQILDYSPEDLSVVYGGVDTQKFHAENDPEKSFRKEIGARKEEVLVGLLARLDPVKGHEYAIEAFSKIKDIETPFRIIALGYENERTFSWLKELAQKFGVLDRLHCFDYRNDIEKVLSSLDLGLISSIGSEANSRAALEFMACSKPMVATSVGVIPEIIQDGEQGFIVPPGNSVKTAEALKKIIQNPFLREKMGKSARSRTMENFSLKKFGSVMEHVYQKLLTK